MSNTNKFVTGAVVVALALAAVAADAQPARDPLDPSSLRPTAMQVGGDQSANAFNPAISVIIDGLYYSDNVHGEASELLGEIDGFAAGHGHDEGHDHGGIERGFNLREVEIAFSATIDPYWDGFLMMALEGGEVELEEAFITSRALGRGLQLKFGRFLSDIGYINKQHPHSWHFTDRPLMNELLFGDHGLQENGLQLSWVAPTPFYSRFGFELLQGENEAIAQHLGHADDVAGTERGLHDKAGPRLVTAFAKFAPNLGYDHALQAGLFAGRSSKYQATDEHSTRFEDHDGTVTFWGTDWVYKYDAGGAYGRGSLVLQGEYAFRKRDLDRQDTYFACHPAALACNDPANAFQPGDIANVQSFEQRQNGYYLQAVYGIAPRWTAGVRTERVGMTNFNGRGFGAHFDPSSRHTAMVTFMPTEYSRFRLQFARGDFAVDGASETFNQVYLQWQMSLGVHGAHSF